MNIHEYQAKELLAKFGVAVPAVCDPTTGDPVVVASFDSLVAGIDFALSGVTIFTDGFENGDTAAWSMTTQ